MGGRISKGLRSKVVKGVRAPAATNSRELEADPIPVAVAAPGKLQVRRNVRPIPFGCLSHLSSRKLQMKRKMSPKPLGLADGANAASSRKTAFPHLRMSSQPVVMDL